MKITYASPKVEKFFLDLFPEFYLKMTGKTPFIPIRKKWKMEEENRMLSKKKEEKDVKKE